MLTQEEKDEIKRFVQENMKDKEYPDDPYIETEPLYYEDDDFGDDYYEGWWD